MVSFSLEKKCSFAHVLDAAAGHSDELPVSRDLEPSGLRQLLRADGHGVGQTVPRLSSHMTAFSFSASSSLAR